ncbi:MAG: amidohydrolase family protein [Vicinamibacterales bacterium]
MKKTISAFIALGVVSLAVVAAQQLPPGQIRPRPAEGREPEFPQPKIREYHPRSTLVVPQHPVPKAKFPVIDFHHHPPFSMTVNDVHTVGDAMAPLNLGLMINANATPSERLKPAMDSIAASRYKGKMVMFVGLDLRNVGPGSGQKIAAQLEADVKAGALGIGELMKSFGLTIKKADGTRLHIDDPELDPVWETAARLKIPVFMHTADPAEFFQPLDYNNERWLELSLYPDRRYQDRSRFPSFEELMAERDRLIARHPNTTWVLAHMGWHSNDLARLGKIFDAHPNVYGELGAVLYDFGRQPRTAHDFFVKYQDRILFGKDSFQPDEYPYYWRVFETNDEYFDYYRDYHAFWKLYGIGLPDAVLKKVYYGNALRITPNLPRAGFPAN